MNPVLFNLGIIQIYWYSAIIFLAFLVGGTLAYFEAKKWKINEDFMINMFFYIIIFAIVGARLYYVAFNWDYYSTNLVNIIKIWEGGLAIHGGILLAGLFIIFYTKKYNVPTLRVFDIMSVSLIIGQAIGRWGNFMNSEAYGPATTLEFLQKLHLPQFIIDGMYINGTYYQPTFLYESLWCLIGFIVLLIFRQRKYTKIGMTASLYAIWYGVGRFFIEGLRQDSLMIGGLKMAQIVSIIFVAVGLFGYLKLRKGSVFNSKYNDQKNIKDESTFR